MTVLPSLPAASLLLSDVWPRDNLVTPHPTRSYDGAIRQVVSRRSLDYVLQELGKTLGPSSLRTARAGTCTWSVVADDEAGPWLAQVPVVVDEPGAQGRSRSGAVRNSFENMRYFARQGLTRFVAEARQLVTIGGALPVAVLTGITGQHPVTFGDGSVRLRLEDAGRSWLVPLGLDATAELLAELVACLVYHYEPERDGGSAISDVSVNDGDFAVSRRSDGSFEVRLMAVRFRERGITPDLLLLNLLQLAAYEPWQVAGETLGIPVPISNPSIAFAGLVRGLRYRQQDLSLPERRGTEQALDWIRDFGRSGLGRAYRPWVAEFLADRLPLRWGGELRERWWPLAPLRQRQHVLALRARHDRNPGHAAAARDLAELVARISREIGRPPAQDPTRVRINDLGRRELLELLRQAGESACIEPEACERLVDELCAAWPYRGPEPLLARAPVLRSLESRLSFGRVIPEQDAGSLDSLPALDQPRTARSFANPELADAFLVPDGLQQAAIRTFPSFETYMDAALHEPSWGYYARRVQFGTRGHFYTHPELLSPHYGRWLAGWAFRMWRDMIEHGELGEADPFPVVELGAGNGRLALDFLDSVAERAGDAEAWRQFAARLEYRIYERSAKLRADQRRVLGERAVVADGDARRPEAALSRDFPNGFRGLVLSNEVPDAFGHHKLLSTCDGQVLAALVVPRLERAASATLDRALARRVAGADRAIRERFGLERHLDDCYLDAETWAELMRAVAVEQQSAVLAGLWFEEAYVPASLFPELAAQLAAGATDYATALAADESAVVVYVNLQASGFVRGLGAALAAGFVLTIDYGDTTWGLIQGARHGDVRLRVYGDTRNDRVPRPNDPYAAPGSQDITADVNFGDLARAAASAGLEVVHYGLETDLAGDELPALLETADRAPFDDFVGNPVFKLLVLGTRPSRCFSGTLLTPLPLSSSAEQVAPSRRPKIPVVERALAALRAEHDTD